MITTILITFVVSSILIYFLTINVKFNTILREMRITPFAIDLVTEWLVSTLPALRAGESVRFEMPIIYELNGDLSHELTPFLKSDFTLNKEMDYDHLTVYYTISRI